jgi:photosystem II stability/assembly factor-like uncharacterized protein
MYGDSGWAVTYSSSGQISNVLVTQDGGRSWVLKTPPIGSDSVIVGFAPISATAALVTASDRGSAAGAVDVFQTSDGGQTWLRSMAQGFRFRGALVAYPDPIHGWLAIPGEPTGQGNQQPVTIDRTSDGGRTWTMVAQSVGSPGKSTLGAPSLGCGKSDLSFLNVQVGWLTGGCEGGVTFAVTVDGGSTWAQRPIASPDRRSFAVDCRAGSCSLTAPRFLSSTVAYMVLHDAAPERSRSWMYISSDSGRTWKISRLPGQDTTISMIDVNTGFAAVGPPDDAGRWFFKTDDGGVTWQSVPTNKRLSYATLACASAVRCWALISTGDGPDSPTVLYATTDAGISWSVLQASTRVD